MKRILIALLAVFAICSSTAAQVPDDLYYVIYGDYTSKLIKVSDGKCVFECEGSPSIAIDKNHNVYTLDGYQNYTLYKNGEVYQKLPQKSDKQYYTSMVMTVVGNDVVVAGVESREFNDKGFESRMVGYVNGKLVYQTEWHRKSLKRDRFIGYRKIIYEGTPAVGTEAVTGFNAIEKGDGTGRYDTRSLVYSVEAVDYVDGNIYTTGWGEREYSETPVGYQTQYMVRRCPRVWKNGKQIIQQYENRTGAGYNIHVMRNGKSILTSGHQRNHICVWDGDKVIVSKDTDIDMVYTEAVIFNGMADKTPLFTRMFLTSKKDILYMVNTAKSGNLEPVIVDGRDIIYVIAIGNDFYALSKNDKIYKYSSQNWMTGEFTMSTVASIHKPTRSIYRLLVAPR